LKKRLQAVETIAQSGNMERLKFMEGATWVANKSLQEANKIQQKLETMNSEYTRRATSCITDPTIKEVNGLDFIALNDWTSEFLTREADEVQLRFQTLLENVNYNMSQAT